MPTLQEQHTEVLDRAEQIAKKVQERGGNFTNAECTEVHQLEAESNRLLEKMESNKQQREKLDQIKGTSPVGKRFTGQASADPLVKHAMDGLVKQSGSKPPGQGGIGLKQQLEPSGSLTLPTDVGLIAESRPEFSLIPLLSQQQLPGDVYSYLRQTERTLNARIVPVGEPKPESQVDLERVEGRAATVAHLSQPVARQYLADYQSLQQFLENELSYGIRRATDQLILNGSGESGEPQGVLTTTGVRHQGAGRDQLASVRSAMTTLAEAGESPTALVLRPKDWEAIELLRDQQERYILAGAPGQQPGRTLWGVPVTLSTELPEGTALLGDFRSVNLLVREAIRVDWSESGDLFERNQVKFRAETRLGLAVTRPGALCTVELLAG